MNPPTPETTVDVYEKTRIALNGQMGLPRLQFRCLVDLRHMHGVEQGDTFLYDGLNAVVCREYPVGERHATYRWGLPLSGEYLNEWLAEGLVEGVRNNRPGLRDVTNRYRLSTRLLAEMPWFDDHPAVVAWREWLVRTSTPTT